jgi:hypothetical protein
MASCDRNERYARHGSAGPIYRVDLAPRELPGGGVDPETQAIVFEEVSEGYSLTAYVHSMWLLDQLSDEDLEGLLGDPAADRGRERAQVANG